MSLGAAVVAGERVAASVSGSKPDITDQLLEWHRWIRADVAPVRGRLLLDNYGTPAGVFATGERAWRAAGCSEAECARLTQWQCLDQHEIKLLEDPNLSICHEQSPDYPELLRHAAGVPAAVYVLGALPEPGMPTVAFVGTRSASPYGLMAAEHFARELARVGVVIVTGGSYGIEAMAIRSALEAGGQCIVVLPSGPDVWYPEDHRRLYKAVMERGAVISQFPMGTRAMAGSFPRRNRLIAALSNAALVVECPRGSHALSVANFANEDSRDVFVIPGPYHTASFEGNHELVRLGATLVTSPAHVLEGMGYEAVLPEEPAVELVTDEQTRLLKLMEDVPRKLDELARLAGRPLADVAADLTFLELSGKLLRTAGGTYCVRA